MSWNPRKEVRLVAQTSDGAGVCASAVSWADALPMFPGLDSGGGLNRRSGHNTRTSVIFLWRDAEGGEKMEPFRVSDFDPLRGDNCSFLLGERRYGAHAHGGG